MICNLATLAVFVSLNASIAFQGDKPCFTPQSIFYSAPTPTQLEREIELRRVEQMKREGKG